MLGLTVRFEDGYSLTKTDMIMKKPLFPSLLLAVLFSGVVAWQQAGEPPALNQPTELIINITSDAGKDAHSALMGMHFAEAALKNDIPVTVFLNVDGVRLLAPRANKIEFQGEKLQQILDGIIDAGGQVLVCPHCLEAEGLSPSALLGGMELAKEEVMMAKIKQNPTVFTY